MRDRMPEETNSGLLGADEYERRAEMGTGKSKSGATIRVAVIAACLLAAGGAIALNSGQPDKIAATPQQQQFAAASPKQVEPQQLSPAPAAAPASKPEERIAATATPKSPPRPAVRPPAAKPAPAPITPPVAVTPRPAATIPEVAPAPAEIAPDAAAPQAGAPIQ